MNAEQKQRAKDLIAAWKSTTYALHADHMAALLQELAEEPEPEPVLVVETEPGYWNRGHYCEGTKSYIDPTKVWGLPVGTKLYTAPPHQSEHHLEMVNTPAPSVPDVANTFKRRAEEIVAMAMNRDNYAETNRLSAALIMDIANAAAAPTPAEAPADVALDAELVKLLELAGYELNACQDAIQLRGGFDPAYVKDAQAVLKKIDAVIERDKLKGQS